VPQRELNVNVGVSFFPELLAMSLRAAMATIAAGASADSGQATLRLLAIENNYTRIGTSNNKQYVENIISTC
jgi:hypothetical protein